MIAKLKKRAAGEIAKMPKWRKDMIAKFLGTKEKDWQMPRSKEKIAKQQKNYGYVFQASGQDRIRLANKKREMKGLSNFKARKNKIGK